MILGFKQKFVPLILSGSKIHTIREDKNNRWGKGRNINFSTGVRTKEYNCFKEGECISTQKIQIAWKENNKGMGNHSWSVKVFIDGRDVTNESDLIDELARNDGFADRKDFFEWEAWHRKTFTGNIIHWTNKRY
jgi:hypothetical protein